MKLSIRSFVRGSVGAVAISAFSTVATADSSDAGASDASPQPIPITILKSSPRTAPGYIFLTPTAGPGATPGGGGAGGAAPQSAQIDDDKGRPVWFHPLASGITAYDLRVQRYRGEPVLTWIESEGAFSTGPTTSYIADRHYNVIATVKAGNGLTEDIHEFELTPEGTALILAYNTVTRDLSSVGGPASGLVTEGVVQEIDIRTGRVLFEWHSLDHIGIDESHSPVSTSPTVAWDYFHANAVSVDEDGNLLVDSRNAWAAYRINRHSGEVIWRLGGTKSDFQLGAGVAFAWQHDPRAVDDHGLIRFFDNEASPTVLPYSRVIWVRHDDRNKTATLERWFKHPDNLSAGSQGDAEGLDNGDTFVGWGALPRFSEFDDQSNLIFDAALPTGYNSYRAWRYVWTGEPDAPPTAIAQVTDGNTVVHAVWNGATEVARWEVLESAGERFRGFPRIVASAEWNGLDTAIPVDGQPQSVVVVAKDRFGRTIGQSVVTAVSP
ncbi:MAG TPA: arylsulfotransferase family protein [Polyangiaceae bacterium]|nr:arylsulfotransferase family protein [Polyangiaceae bacterium]